MSILGMSPAPAFVASAPPVASAGQQRVRSGNCDFGHSCGSSLRGSDGGWAALDAAAFQTTAAVAAVSLVFGLVRGLRRRAASGAARPSRAQAAIALRAGPAVESPPKRKTRQREAPTPYPKGRMQIPQVERLLELLAEDFPNEGALCRAMDKLQDLHEYDMQWVEWPQSLDEVRRQPYKKGLFQMLRGILRMIAQGRGQVRTSAISLCLSLCIGGATYTRVPAKFAVECGAISSLCRAAREGSESAVLGIIRHIAVNAPTEMLATVIDGGAIESAIAILHKEVAAPMDQLTALDLILALAKRAPAKTAQVGTYEAVKIVSNEALVPRRNKIMNFLRPLVEDVEDGGAGTTIRIGGLKF
eukprot:TRINITY_DN103279_c0_g1_i1.p1 TRINITY_DN103279_c0_g1~~TRINITY_DN103279_c0_g1_i1.p1  ORF type:complete len:359 (+),score=77.26 TRINITY_DN103279_c0_g1_i1:45-1121(+)